MAQQRLDGGDGERVRSIDIAERMERSFLDYSMSVIVGRALPDVRDGLKPVQRRILYAMDEAGLRPGRPMRKCASAVGDVMKKYHPHGDASIYDALVRMAQDFSTRYPLVDGRGNFGSVDGDPPAAMRYTEASLSAIAMELLDGIAEDTVPFVESYDGTDEQPVVLPARLPNLLLNGATGIAVGMATNIPPHNLREVVNACIHLLRRPDASLEELMRIVPAPDFPTGGRIVATDGIRDAYLTGRGAVTTEAVAATETRSGGLPRIVITEIPYQVNKATLLTRIADLVKNRTLESVRDLRDESSREGMRIVIELKRGEDPGRVLARLYDLTDLRSKFNVNMVALVPADGGALVPQTLGLRECLRHYIEFQRDVVRRRTRHRRERAAARAHVLEGLLVALDHLDEVIALIRAAPSADAARTELMTRFGLTEIQATAILDMQLRRLAQLERDKLRAEHAELLELIAELDAILADPGRLDALLVEELTALREEHGDPRRSRLQDGVVDDVDDAVPTLEAQEVTVTVSAAGFVKVVPRRRRTAAHRSEKDPLVAALRATTDATILLVDRDGAGWRVDLADVPVVTARQRGVSLGQLHGDGPDAAIVGAALLRQGPQDGDDPPGTVVTVSRGGLVKRTAAGEFLGRARTMVAAGVRDDDELVAVASCTDDDDLVIAHGTGLVIRFPAEDVRVMGRTASGVAGIRVPRGTGVVSLGVMGVGAEDPPAIVTVGVGGSAKRTPAEEYPRQGRGGKGVQTGEDRLAWCGPAVLLHATTAEGPMVLASTEVAAARRAAPGTPALPPVTGAVVAESG